MLSILYKIRNGKAFATETEEFNLKQKKEAKKSLDIVLDSIIKDVRANVKGKKIYVPDVLKYALPATEKQFTGMLPSGSYVNVPKQDLILGVHWENVGQRRIDLDLSLIDSEGSKLGWDGSYRNDESDVLFSGDLTTAPKPNGASELFYIQKQTNAKYILFLNYFNHEEDVEVPFKIILAQDKPRNFKSNYMLDPNNIISTVKSSIKNRQKVLGILKVDKNASRFYFAESDLGNSITSYGNNYAEHARKYLFDFYSNTVDLVEILEKSGAKIVRNNEKCDIDLSPETLEKDSILKLFYKK